MNPKKILKPDFLLKAIFALSVLILLFISAVSYKHNRSLTDSSEALNRSYLVRSDLDRVISFLEDAETGQRGFLLSKDSAFLSPYWNARGRVDKCMYNLRAIAGRDAEQKHNFDTLDNLISLRFAYMNKLLSLSSKASVNDSLLHAALVKEKAVMDNIRAQVTKMADRERIALTGRKERLDSAIFFTPLFTLILLAFSGAVFAFAYMSLNRQIGVLQRSNEALTLSAETMDHAERIGNFSTWICDLEKNEFKYSDNLFDLLGLKQKGKPLSLADIQAGVHPEDLPALKTNLAAALEHRRPGSSLYRAFRPDGEMRWFRSAGKIVRTLAGKEVYLGVITDVTEQYKKNLSLQERNYELEQTNKELASFNYVASHDLQEPLRIIQTYISRIKDKQFSTLSDTTKEYFERIQMSANRMQVLINDLLVFSRTNKSEKVFERTDLNILLQHALQDLAAVVEEKNARITTDDLPSLNVIPYQIQQLFLNLVGNALKYAKPGVTPEISITHYYPEPHEFPEQKRDLRLKYVCISVADNGMGFEQQYAENIFVLFKRLHQKNEYPGTGIGLSICKKIATAHSGFIVAEGKPDVGAVFRVILPA